MNYCGAVVWSTSSLLCRPLSTMNHGITHSKHSGKRGFPQIWQDEVVLGNPLVYHLNDPGLGSHLWCHGLLGFPIIIAFYVGECPMCCRGFQCIMRHDIYTFRFWIQHKCCTHRLDLNIIIEANTETLHIIVPTNSIL